MTNRISLAAFGSVLRAEPWAMPGHFLSAMMALKPSGESAIRGNKAFAAVALISCALNITDRHILHLTPNYLKFKFCKHCWVHNFDLMCWVISPITPVVHVRFILYFKFKLCPKSYTHQ